LPYIVGILLILVLFRKPVLGTKDTSGKWNAKILSHNHNGTDKGEVERLKSEHPGEDGVVLNDRVLGAIAVTRGISGYQ
jgi:pyruvate dehydrogenase phosphatase